MISDLISVIIPVYNHANRLAECLFSIANQTYKNLEVIIVNDGSKDNFAEVVEKIKKRPEFKNICINIINQDNFGAPKARNVGFANSKGEYVIFWDADTVGKPQMLYKMLESLKQNLSASYSYSQFKFGWKLIKSQPFNESALKKNNFIDTTSLIRRVDFIPFDESVARFQDWDLWLTLLKNKKTGIFIPEVLYSKRVFGRKGLSSWLPKFVYKLPMKINKVKNYESAKQIIRLKHGLNKQ